MNTSKPPRQGFYSQDSLDKDLFIYRENLSNKRSRVQVQNPMSNFLRKTIFFGICNVRTLPPTRIPGFLSSPYFFPLRLFSSSSNQHSFTVSYLINTLGFSPESALSASRSVNFDTSEKPDDVIAFFKNHGFSQTQISGLVRRHPKVFLSDIKNTIFPKLEFLEAKGVSKSEMAEIISVHPGILRASLAGQLMPSYDFFKDLLKSDEKVIFAIKRFGNILTHNVEKEVAPKIDILREHGVSDSNIASLFKYEAMAFVMANLVYFKKLVEEVKEMGFDSSKGTFVIAMRALRSMSKSKWESKVNAYKKWGWRDEEISEAFLRSPWCMMASEDKIMACLDFFSSKMGLRPCDLAKCPVVLSMSLEKRLVPRFSVYQVLLSKGLLEKEAGLSALFLVSEIKFLQKFVAPYEKEVPELLKFYKEKVDRSSGTENDDKV